MTKTVMLGRGDYGWGVEADLVTVDGEEFATYGGKFYSPCGMCSPGWSGSKTHFSHRHAGVCYQCTGRGWHKVYASQAAVERLVKRRKADRARRERQEVARLAAQDKALADWKAAHPEVAAMLAEVTADMSSPADDETTAFEADRAARQKWGDFLTSLAAQAEHRPLTEGQTDAVAEAVEQARAKHAERAAQVAASRHAGEVTGKVTGTGTVTVRVSYETDYGPKVMLVVTGTGEDEGVTFKTSGTGKTLWDAAKGDTVEVTGTVKAHDTYEGVAQTVLTRAKVTVLVEAEEPDGH